MQEMAGESTQQSVTETFPSDIDLLTDEQYAEFLEIPADRVITKAGMRLIITGKGGCSQSADASGQAAVIRPKRFAAGSCKIHAAANDFLRALHKKKAKLPYHPCTISMLKLVLYKLNQLDLDAE